MPVANGSLEFGVWNSYWDGFYRRGDIVNFEVIAEQDSHCTYNLTLKRVLTTIVAVQK